MQRQLDDEINSPRILVSKASVVAFIPLLKFVTVIFGLSEIPFLVSNMEMQVLASSKRKGYT